MMSKATIVIAETWKAFEWWCRRNKVDPRDRRSAIPLISADDSFRIYGRVASGAQVVKVGDIDIDTLAVFRRQLIKSGVVI
jgi:hypothetical protein